MATILLIAEQAHGHLKKATLSALTAAQKLAEKNGGRIEGVVIGAGAGQSAQELAGYVPTVHAVEGGGFEHALAETHAAAAAEAAKKVGATDVVLAATAYGKDIAPPGDDEPVGLNCRIYRRRDGRVSPTPDPEDVRDALTSAIA